MNSRTYSLISKYSLVLSLCYLISYIFGIAFRNYEFENGPRYIGAIRAIIPQLFDFLISAATAVLVQQDINKYTVKTRYVIIATILYRPLGITAFLLFFIFHEVSAGKGEIAEKKSKSL